MSDITIEILPPSEIVIEVNPPSITNIEIANDGVAAHEAKLDPHPQYLLASQATNLKQLVNQIFNPTNGQTVFTLSAIAVLPELSSLYLNGVKAVYGLHYTINSTVLTWVSPVQLQSTDDFEILYYRDPV